MNRRQVVILIPCHGLEDFPTDLGEADAAGLLNAFAAAYHPALLAAARELPTWRRADDPPADPGGKIVVVPHAAEARLPHGWLESARDAGTIVAGAAERSALLAGLLPLATAGSAPDGPPEAGGPNAGPADLDPELVADFLAFGTAILLLDVLTRRMHYYSNLDGGPLRLEVLAAADAAVAGDAESARRRLSRAFELLLEARERFFPVAAYLIDLCLVIPRLADKLPAALSPLEPSTLLATAADWEQIAAAEPDLIERLKLDWGSRRVCLVGGEFREGPTALLPVESVLWEFDRGLAAYRRVFGRTPKVWARRRYGFSTLIPQVLDRSGVTGALHAALDDGVYPDDEWSKFRWDGCDGVGVDAFSRIPLAADAAATYLRLPTRLAETMEQDGAAAVMFARWPEVSAPWWDDLRRVHRYAPVFGKFVTLETFCEETEPATRVLRHESKGYFAPYLTQAVARGEADPISTLRRRIVGRHRLDAAGMLGALTGLLGRPAAGSAGGHAEAEDRFEAEGRGGDTELGDAARALADAVLTGAAANRGAMVVNTLAFPRRTTAELPAGFSPPAVGGPVKHVQFDGVRREVTIDLPAGGFVWLPATSPPQPRRDEPATAADGVLRNEAFEVRINESTGGIAYLKGYGRSPKRISQQLAFRFSRKRTVRSGDWGEEQSYYSEMRGRSVELTCAGPSLAEAVTTGDLVDQTNGDVLATFRQTTRVRRGAAAVELEVELEPARLPSGDPWTNYYACRFAWDDETAAVTRGVQGVAQPAPDGRFDAPHYIEVSDGERRTTVVPAGLPFHRRTDGRMLDTLLVAAGETGRRFRFVIACDEPYPMRAALDACVPAVVVPTEAGPPRAGTAGWLVNVDAKNVQVTSLRPLAADEGRPAGVAVRLAETEGRAKRARLSLFKAPSSARLVNLVGETMATLAVEGDAVVVDVQRYEIATVELRF